MTIGRHDELTLRAISPSAVAGWLRMRGFAPQGVYGDYGAIFARADDSGTRELILPTSPQARDFDRRMAELVNDIAEMEGRSGGDVLTDLTLAPFDVIKVRSPDADDYGSVSLAAGLDLHEQAREIVLAAANAAAAPRPRRTWRGRRSEEVASYLGSLRLGQSQRGSFVMTILSPWDFIPNASPSLDLGEPTFGRRVTRSLASALTATEVAIRAAVAAGVASFADTHMQGVSSNLCLALAKLAREGNGVDVSVDWSPVHPEEAPVTIRLRREDAPILTEAAKQLGQEWDEPDVNLQGLVAAIAEDPDRFDGLAVVEALIDNIFRKVRIQFGVAERKTIYDAAKNKRWISVVGELSLSRGRLSLLNPRDLTLVEAATLDDTLA